MSGLFVTFEGVEGAGKSTLVRSLAEIVRSEGHDVLVTREPGGSPLAERLRSLLLGGAFKSCGAEVEATIFAAARSDHFSKTISPVLDSGGVVLCDRFYDSTRALQGAAGQVSESLLDDLVDEAVGDRRPDLTLILDCPVEEGLSRVHARRRPDEAIDRFEGEGVAYHCKVRDSLLSIASSEPSRCRVIDAARDPAHTLAQALGVLVPLLKAVRKP